MKNIATWFGPSEGENIEWVPHNSVCRFSYLKTNFSYSGLHY